MSRAFIRPVRRDDLGALWSFAQDSGGGMTNLPADREALKARIEFSVESFAGKPKAPGGEAYMLVLEQDGRVVGSAAVFSQIGLQAGFINYRINQEFYSSIHRETPLLRRVLVPSHDFTGRAEVGSLYVSAAARGGGLGKLLARSRYMFIAQKPEIIADHVCAELRGWRASDGSQPFWNAVGRHFFEMEFEAADAYNAAHGNQFIEDLLPRYPIYVALLPQEAQACLGRPHDKALPAYKMLIQEGFAFNNYIDVFDAGPLLDAPAQNIRTIRDSRLLTVVKVTETEAGDDALLAAGEVASFRACLGKAKIDGEDATIDRSVAAALNVSEGEKIRWGKW